MYIDLYFMIEFLNINIYIYIVDIKQNSGIQLIRAFERLVCTQG